MREAFWYFSACLHVLDTRLLELDDVGVQQDAVIDDLALHIDAGNLITALHELDGHLRAVQARDEAVRKLHCGSSWFTACQA